MAKMDMGSFQQRIYGHGPPPTVVVQSIVEFPPSERKYNEVFRVRQQSVCFLAGFLEH